MGIRKSPTYTTTNFKPNEDELHEKDIDPWDNPSDDHDY